MGPHRRGVHPHRDGMDDGDSAHQLRAPLASWRIQPVARPAVTRAESPARPLRPTSGTSRIYPPAPTLDPKDAVSPDEWGFADTSFAVNPTGAITVTGNSYPGLSGQVLPNLLPWFRTVLGINFSLDEVRGGSYPPPVPDSKPAPAFLAELEGFMAADQITTRAEVRLRQGHGDT